jgi:hypothetical protein
MIAQQARTHHIGQDLNRLISNRQIIFFEESVNVALIKYLQAIIWAEPRPTVEIEAHQIRRFLPALEPQRPDDLWNVRGQRRHDHQLLIFRSKTTGTPAQSRKPGVDVLFHIGHQKRASVQDRSEDPWSN